MTVRVLVVDDQAPFRRAARAVVAASAGFELVGEAGSGEQAVELVDELEPDLVVMDVKMAGIGGIAATRSISARHPETLTLLVSTYREEELPDDATRCGAAGYVHKSRFSGELLRDLWDGAISGGR
jgi:two-component system, NarL family, invasion response regulator UvrY